MAAFHRFEENLRHYHCVVCKLKSKHGRCLLRATTNIYLLEVQARQEAVSIISAENDMDPGSVPAELQGLSEVEELMIMSIYRKQGGQRGYKGHVLSLPEDIQGFLNSLPTNVSGLPILVIRKQGAGEFLK